MPRNNFPPIEGPLVIRKMSRSEFDAELVDCPVRGCPWRGRHLSGHAAKTHGIGKRTLKEAVGLNLARGLVTLGVRRKLQEHMATAPQVTALKNYAETALPLAIDARSKSPFAKSRSTEAIGNCNHMKTERACARCGRSFLARSRVFCGRPCEKLWREDYLRNGGAGK